MSNDTSHILWYPGQDISLKNIVKAENCSLFDETGRRYVDLESGVWCLALGHSNPKIQRVIEEQSSKIAHTGFNYTSAIVEDAARKILSLAEMNNGKCLFLSSGSEAVEYGLRIARTILDQPLFLTMSDSYFGAYGSASVRTEDQWFNFDWSPCVSCSAEVRCDSDCEYWASIPFEKIGALIFEPGSSSGLVRFPPKKLIRNMGASIKEKGGIVLANEVTTGFGRTGRWFGYQHYELKPDIVVLGKAVGNGYPVSVTACNEETVKRLGQRVVKHSQSHQNDPLGAAIAQQVIAVIEKQNLIEVGANIGATLVSGLEKIGRQTDRIAEIRGRGLMIAIEFEGGPGGSYATLTHRELMRRGYLVGNRVGFNVLRLDPSLTINESDIQGFLTSFADLIDRL